MLTGFAFAGSPGTLAPGTRIDGVNVGGLSAHAARTLLEQRSTTLAHVPVTFVAGTHRFSIRPDELSVGSDWAQAVAAAQNDGDGSSVIRGFQRLALRFFPVKVEAKPRAYTAAVNYEIGLLADQVDKPYKPARLIRNGLQLRVVPGQAGERLDRQAAASIVVGALASLTRPGGTVELPTLVEQPTVTAADLAGARTQAEQALSAPVTLELGGAGSPSPRSSSPRCCSSRPPAAHSSCSGAARRTRTSRSSTAPSDGRRAARASRLPAAT